MLQLKLTLVNAFTGEEYHAQQNLESTWVRKDALADEISAYVRPLAVELCMAIEIAQKGVI